MSKITRPGDDLDHYYYDDDTYDTWYQYALRRVADQDEQQSYRQLKDVLSGEDVAAAYAMACVMNPDHKNAFWRWAEECGIRGDV